LRKLDGLIINFIYTNFYYGKTRKIIYIERKLNVYKYKIILFDLDGTLSDPKLGITKSVQYALQRMGIVEPDLDKLECFIGPPLQASFAEYYDLDEESTQRAIDFYRERFKDKGMFENELYSEIPLLLKSLKEQEYILVIATSKPTVFSEEILKHFNINQYFKLVVGSNLDGTRTSKTEIIQYILDKYNEHRLDDFIMIGDRKHDIIGANNAGIDSIGVTYGYGPFKELSDSSPTYIVNCVEEIKDILISSEVVSRERV
jgi:phosphoglycolate phosphatase